MSAALKNVGYYYDMTAATLYMTTEFEKKSNTYGTNEYHMLNRILDRFPKPWMRRSLCNFQIISCNNDTKLLCQAQNHPRTPQRHCLAHKVFQIYSLA